MDIVLKFAKLSLYPIIAFLISLVLTRLCIAVLPRLGYVDRPRNRHIHDKLIPRGGGIAVIIAVFSSLALFFHYLPETLTLNPQIKKMWLPALLLIILGLMDDRFELKSWIKLPVQCIVGILVWYNFDMQMSIYDWEVPHYLSLIFTVMWVLLIVNAFNLIDGLDGLATGISIISATCMAFWFFLARGDRTVEVVVMLVLVGAALGFLPYNFNPAKIFLGDTGSTFLGFCFAVSGLGTLDRAVTFTSLLLPILVIGVPIFDVLLAIWRRSVRKLLNKKSSGIMDGDQDHLHHRLLRQTHTQSKTALVMYFISIIFAFLVITFILLRDTMPAIGYFLLLLAILVMLRRLAVIELFDSVTLIRTNLSTPRKSLLANMLHPLIDLSIFVFSAAVFSILFQDRLCLTVICYLTAPGMLLLFITRTYRVYWLRASLSDRLKLLQLVLCGSVISILLLALFYWTKTPAVPVWDKKFIASGIFFIFMTGGLISLERFLVHYAEALWVHKFLIKHDKTPVRTMIFGGGLNCRLLIRYLYCAHKKETDEQIIGILDDDNVLQGLKVYGFNVYGGSNNIAMVYEKHPFDKLTIAINDPDKKTEETLLDFCRSKDIKVTRFRLQENDFQL